MATLSIFSDGVFGTEDLDKQRPHEMICSITTDVMQDPVIAADGYTYERSAIQEWFSLSDGRSPKTGLPLVNKNLIPNHALKTMIREWTPGRQGIFSPLDHLKSADIAKNVAKEFKDNEHLLHSSKGKNIVAFLGNTGSGKSTLVNLLAGKELVEDQYGQGYILATPGDSSAMKIGTTGDSETLYPKYIAVDDLLLFDLPGFNDTEGSERNLVNAAFTRQILIEASSVRFVFVAGEDEFTALRGDPVKKMFDAIRLLFVTDTQSDDLINNSVFVVTKSTCSNKKNAINYLLGRSSGANKDALQTQLASWDRFGRFCSMYSPILRYDVTETRGRIIECIRQNPGSKIVGINVSVLYPPETKRPLISMFSTVMQEELSNKIRTPFNSLPEYDHALGLYNAEDFWKKFDEIICSEVQSVSLLKEFCIDPYNEAMRTFERENEKRRQKYIKNLIDKREERVLDLEQITHQRAEKVINSLAQRQKSRDFIPFDFAYHKDFYNEVCGADCIKEIAVDAVEQEVVRQYYADFISHHSTKQMLDWHERFIKPQHDDQIKTLSARYDDQIKTLSARLDAFVNVQRAVVEEKQPDRIERSLAAPDSAIPKIARGYEAIYDRFMNGRLVYKGPAGERSFLISDIANSSLEGEFNLNGLTFTSGSKTYNISDYLRVKLGYRKVKENEDKTTAWIVPQFVSRAGDSSFNAVQWTSDVGIFWTWGKYDLTDFDYLTSMQFDEISTKNLYDLAAAGIGDGWRRVMWPGTIPGVGRSARFPSFLIKF